MQKLVVFESEFVRRGPSPSTSQCIGPDFLSQGGVLGTIFKGP